METIILDWSALSQIVRQGPEGVLEQALLSTGSRLAITNFGAEEIPYQFKKDLSEFKIRIKEATEVEVLEIEIPESLLNNTRANRQLGVVFDSDGRAKRKQLADAAIRWLEKEKKIFSQGGYRLLSNDRGLIDSIEQLAPGRAYQTNLDLLGRAVIRGDVPADRYRSFLQQFSLPNGGIQGIGKNFSEKLILDEKSLASLETVLSGRILVPDNISLVNPREVARRFLKLVRGGAPVFVLGLGAVPVYSIVKARAEERNISFSQAAREVGLDLGEEELKSLAADVGVDLAVSLTPVGVLKKAWDVLGNIDDIVALTQLYGEAYPDNQVIQEMAELARTVEGSDAFQAYSYARDALTGAVGGALDRILGTGEDDEETAAAVAELRTSLQDGGAVLQAANGGATQAELAETLSADVRRRMAERRSLFGAETVATADAPLSAPRPDTGLLSPESSPGDGVLREGQRMPLEDVPMLPGSAAILPPEFVREGGAAAELPAVGAEEGETRGQGVAQEGVPVPRPKPGEEPAVPGAGTGNPKVAQRPARKTSYDTYRKLGRTPEEEKAAIADYKTIFRKSYLDVGGDEELADLVATERFKLDWGLSEFAPDAEGTVMKHPAEKVYPDLEKDGHGYVRKEVKTLLDKQGVKAAKWYLSPNGKTGSDHGRAPMDETGYGPRMSLIVEDEAGDRMEVTDSFQADMASARQRFLTARLKKDREEAKRYGIKVPPPGTKRPRVRLEMPASSAPRISEAGRPPVPRAKPRPEDGLALGAGEKAASARRLPS